jgi:hypothetical protein
MDKSDLKKNFLEFVAYLEKMAIMNGERSHMISRMKMGGSGKRYVAKSSDAGSPSSGH